MNILKIVVIIILIGFLMVAIGIIALSVNHQVKLKKEQDANRPIGQMVNVNDTKMHVYTEGQGETTLVFMSGHGTSSPVLDFKPLWMRLKDHYKIVVVEKPGYGFSDTSNGDKDLDTLLSHTRDALSLLDIEGPYVLIPHSLSGLEAIYWAQIYPKEVIAIIGLDACTPQSVDLLTIPSKMELSFVHLISRIGLSRLMPDASLKETLPLIDSAYLTKDEEKIYKAMFFKSALTKDMLNELKFMKSNQAHILSLDAPKDTPMYFFISSQQNELVNGWQEALMDYLNPIVLKQSMVLDTSHYVHHAMSEMIADEIKVFLDGLA